MTPEAERAALEELVQSEGWALLKELVARKHGTDAQVREIDAVVRGVQPSEGAYIDGVIVPQIISASKAAYGVLELPVMRLRQLPDARKDEQRARADPFKGFRRA